MNHPLVHLERWFYCQMFFPRHIPHIRSNRSPHGPYCDEDHIRSNDDECDCKRQRNSWTFDNVSRHCESFDCNIPYEIDGLFSHEAHDKYQGMEELGTGDLGRGFGHLGRLTLAFCEDVEKLRITQKVRVWTRGILVETFQGVIG